ncbi:EamA-like transporter family protein [Rhodobacteraceae bacterium THAF1]|uniref:DMT family transporter n=1 Tax=Palleronia sp. THAF1 TaxID=2587842 RepID=UPI000F3D5149|nr:DMT family transporter [Palleronia sp. THAF1]QFU07628.1 EamA-like transporter family protein [Palleronia sp. THAF1]VDC22800.1 EamA-like transporter family protein [Rhodobacteraceae bacterium THAF1]
MPLSDNMRGALFMIAVTLCFTVGDTIVKAAAEDLPVFQFIALRGLVATPILIALAWRSGARIADVSGRDRRLIVLRSVAEVGAMLCFFIALVRMPIANVTAILQAIPLTLTLAGALILKEPVGWRRMGAIVLGFVGVLLIVRPGAADFDPNAGFALLSVLFVTIRDLTVRRITRSVPAFLVAAAMSGIVTVGAGIASLFTPWQSVGAGQSFAVTAAAIAIVGGYLFLVYAMRWGALAVVTPFRYTALIWALIAGWLVFGDWPAWPTWIGAGLIVATGLFTFWRERALELRLQRKASRF